MYQLDQETWNVLSEKLNFDFLNKYRGKKTQLTFVIKFIEFQFGITTSANDVYKYEEIELLVIINRWYKLVEKIKLLK